MNNSSWTAYVACRAPGHGAAIAADVARMDGYARCFGSPEQLAAQVRVEPPRCVIIDLAMLETDVAGFVQSVAPAPVLAVGCRPEIRHVVESMHRGVATFIELPFGPGELGQALGAVFDEAGYPRGVEERIQELKQRLGTLTDREDDVLNLIVAGTANKVIARNLQISHRTVDRLRATVFRKLGAECAVDAARMVTELRVLRRTHTGAAAARPPAAGQGIRPGAHRDVSTMEPDV